MKELNKDYTQADLDAVLKHFNAEIIENDGIYNLYIAGAWKGNCGSMEGIIQYLNLKISTINDARQESEHDRVALDEALAGATDAVLLDNGKPIATVKTAARGGECIEVAGCIAADGTPVNVRLLKVSRNRRFLSDDLPGAGVKLGKSGVFYML